MPDQSSFFEKAQIRIRSGECEIRDTPEGMQTVGTTVPQCGSSEITGQKDEDDLGLMLQKELKFVRRSM